MIKGQTILTHRQTGREQCSRFHRTFEYDFCGAGTAYPSGAHEFTHPTSPVFSGVRVARSLVLWLCFVDRCLSFCTFSFGHYDVCPSIYEFWLSFGIFKLFLYLCKKHSLNTMHEIVWMDCFSTNTNLRSTCLVVLNLWRTSFVIHSHRIKTLYILNTALWSLLLYNIYIYILLGNLPLYNGGNHYWSNSDYLGSSGCVHKIQSYIYKWHIV